MCETSKPMGNGNTSLSPPSPDFGSKMQLQGCMANSSFELRFCFNRRRRPKGHRQGRAKTRVEQHYRPTTACAIFLHEPKASSEASTQIAHAVVGL